MIHLNVIYIIMFLQSIVAHFPPLPVTSQFSDAYGSKCTLLGRYFSSAPMSEHKAFIKWNWILWCTIFKSCSEKYWLKKHIFYFPGISVVQRKENVIRQPGKLFSRVQDLKKKILLFYHMKKNLLKPQIKCHRELRNITFNQFYDPE